jgi:hypothetical protein
MFERQEGGATKLVGIAGWVWENLIPHPFQFFKSLVSRGGPSTARTVTVISCVFLNIECLILTWFRAKYWSQVTAEMTVLTSVLSALIGYVYHRAKVSQDRGANNPDLPPPENGKRPEK